MNQANCLLGYEVIIMIIVLVTTKKKSSGTNFNQENWMLVIWLMYNGVSLILQSRFQWFNIAILKEKLLPWASRFQFVGPKFLFSAKKTASSAL